MDLSKRNSSGGGGNNNALVWIVIGGLAIIAGGFLIATLTPSVLPRQASTQARQVDDLFRFLLLIGGIVFLLVQGVLAFSVIRFRARKGDTGDGPAVHGNTTLEFIWTAIPAVIVLVITLYSYQVWITTRDPQDNEQLVGTVASRFAWSFSYNVPAADFPAGVDVGELDDNVRQRVEQDGYVRLVSNQLHTYVDQPVNVQLETQDVIHSFWVPAMRIKQDVIPGRVTNIRFRSTEPGTYRVVCAELCGSGHGYMAGQIVDDALQGAWIVVHPDEETYRREFLEPETRSVIFPPEDPAALGRQILASGLYPCATCHVLGDLDWTGNIGPSLDGVGDRTQRLSATGLDSMAAYLEHSLRQPAEYLVPGYSNLMPQFNPEPDQPNYMPEEDLQAIVAYLLTQTGD